MTAQMAIAIALLEFNDLGRSVTLFFFWWIISSTDFLYVYRKNEEVWWSFWKMQHRIPVFLALRLSVRRFQMPLEELSFVKTLATFEVNYATDALLYKLWLRSFTSVDSPSIFLSINPCRPCWKTRQFFKIRVVFHTLYLWNKVGDPQVFL